MGKAVASADAQVQCLHQGMGSIMSPGQMKLTVKGKPTFTAISGTAGGCTQVPPPQSNKPCTTFSIPSGTATKLTVGRQPVVLEGDSGTSDGTPTNGCQVKSAGQTMLTSA